MFEEWWLLYCTCIWNDNLKWLKSKKQYQWTHEDYTWDLRAKDCKTLPFRCSFLQGWQRWDWWSCFRSFALFFIALSIPQCLPQNIENREIVYNRQIQSIYYVNNIDMNITCSSIIPNWAQMGYSHVTNPNPRKWSWFATSWLGNSTYSESHKNKLVPFIPRLMLTSY